MTAAQLADKLLASEHADVLRESVAWMVAELMEADVSAQIGAELGERTPDGDPAQRLPVPRLGHPGRRARAGHPQAADRQLLPVVSWSRAGAPSRPWSRWSRRPMSTGCRTRKVDRLVEQLGLHRHEQGSGVPAVPRPGRAGPGVPGAAAGGRATRICGWTPRSSGSASRVGCATRRLVIAYGVHAAGRREVIGLDVGEAETEASGASSCAACGPAGWTACGCVISDAHAGLRSDRPGARLPLAALHRPLPPRHARPRRQGPAAD